MRLFFTPDIKDDSSYVLNENESKHAIKVLRLKEGDQITLMDGKGCLYSATITNDSSKKCQVSIDEKKYYPPKNYHLHIAIAPTKNNDRIEWFIEKATEIGIDEITPIICSNSERKVIKTDRLYKRAVAATKQSLTPYLPIINEPISFDEFIETGFNGAKYIAHCYEFDKTNLKDSYNLQENCVILIGPEGDFTQEEVSKGIKQGYVPVSLSNSRLRTETAGIVACHTINLINE